MAYPLLRINNEFWNHERSLSALLVYLAISVFVWIPLGDYPGQWWSFLISDILFNLIILAGVFSVMTRWKRQLFFIIIAMAASFSRILYFVVHDQWIQVSSYFFAIVFFVYLVKRVLSHIFKDGPVNFYRIQGSVVVFMLVGLIYSLLYTLVEFFFPGSFSSTHVSSAYQPISSHFMYFSFVTMTTLGLGDMIPVGSLAKSLVVFQGMIGLLYPVIMIARLVSMEVAHSTLGKRN